MNIYKVMNAKFQVICHPVAETRADAIVSAKAQGFDAVHVDFVKVCDYGDYDDELMNMQDDQE